MPIASWGDTLGAIQRRQVYDAQVNGAAQTANPALAPAVVAQTNSMPWASPQTGYVLATNGNTPGDPISQAVATSTVNRKGGGFWGALGHVVDAGARAAIHLGSDIQGAGKVAARGAFTAANALYEVPMGAVRDVASSAGDIAAGALSGLATGAATGAMTLTPWGVVGGALGGAVIGGVGGALSQAKGVKVEGGFVNPLSQSAGGLALQKLVSGNAGDIDLGTGFMPGGALTAQATKNAQQAASINGHALTPGRMLASSVWRPGTGGYNILSGVADGITRWELDPGRYLGEEAGARIQATKVIPGAPQAVTETGAAAKAGPITKLLTRTGVLDSADPAFNEQVARDFLTTDPAARRFVARAAATDSAYDINKATNGKLPSALLNQLAAQPDEQGVVDTLLNHVQSQGLKERAAVQSGRPILTAVQNFRPVARLAPVYDRLTSTLPAHSVDLLDVDKPGGAFKLDNARDQLGNFLTQARYNDAEKAPILNRLMATTTADEAKQVITETIHGDLRSRLLAAGAPEEVVQNVLKTTAADRDALLSQVHGEVAGNTVQRQLAVGQPELVPAERPGTYVPGTPSTAGRWEYLGAEPGAGPVFEGPAQPTLPGAQQPGRLVPGAPGTSARWVPAGQATGGAVFEEPQTLFAGMERPGTPTQQILSEAGTPARYVPGEAPTPGRIEPTGGPAGGPVFGGPAQPALTGAERPATFVPGQPGVPGTYEYRGTVPTDQPVFMPLNKASDVLQADATHVQLPDARAIKRMTTPSARLNAIYNSRAFLETEHAADAFMGAWKKLNLQRVALPLRMLAMAQAKMAANGLETPMADPLNMFANIIGRGTKAGALEGMVEGTPLSQAEEMMGFSRRLSGNLAADDLTPWQRTLKPGDPGFARSWSARVAELHADPVARAVATDGADAATRSMWNGDLAEHRAQLIAEGNNPELAGQEGVRAHVATVADNMRAITANNPDLVDSVATGRLVGVDLLKAHPGGLVNPDLEAALQRLVEDPDVEVPNMMKAAKPSEIDPDYGNKVGRVTQWFYSRLVGAPMDALVNHPAFNQLYWQAVADHASMLDEDGAAALRARLAGDSKLVQMPADTKSSVLASLDRTATPGPAGFSDVDKLARAQAIQNLQDMTIDMSKKQGWQDAMRHVMPFAKHWQQETSQWARLLATHPEAFQKAQMAVHGAEGSGFFHTNDQGALVFNYPFSGFVSKHLTGVDMPITGKAGGFSTFTTDLFPGFGPMISVAASKLLPNKPEFDSIKNFLSPYGDPTAQGVAASVLPSWAKTLQTALSDPQNDRDAANTTMQVARYLVSTGQYSMDTPDDVQKTLDAAGARAKHLLELQAIGKFVLPASPSLLAQAKAGAKQGVSDGRTVTAKLLSDDLIKMRQDDYENSTQNFLDKYGDNALLFLQSATRPVVAGAAGTKEQEDWARQNPDLVKAFPNSYAFFAPQGAQTPDFNTITRQLHTGERQTLTPAQQVAMANDQVGSMVYYQAKAKLGPRISAPQQAWLADLKGALQQQYPGFGVPIAGVAARVTDTAQGVQDVVIPEMRKALDNPKMAAGQTGQALAQYMELRDGIDRIAQSRGLKPNAFAQAAHADDLRAVLNNAAQVLSQNNPGFSMLFDRLLSRELRTDTTPAAVTGA